MASEQFIIAALKAVFRASDLLRATRCITHHPIVNIVTKSEAFIRTSDAECNGPRNPGLQKIPRIEAFQICLHVRDEVGKFRRVPAQSPGHRLAFFSMRQVHSILTEAEELHIFDVCAWNAAGGIKRP